MNGGTVVAASTVVNAQGQTQDPTVSFRVIGTGDFTGDGHNDSIVFQNNNGRPAIWIMNGFTAVNEVALPNPGSSWVLTGIGNYTGAANGQSDLFFENAGTGQAAVWTMNGTNVVSSTVVTPPTTFQSYAANPAPTPAASSDGVSLSLTADLRTTVLAPSTH
jgi:hypothetical protein